MLSVANSCTVASTESTACRNFELARLANPAGEMVGEFELELGPGIDPLQPVNHNTEISSAATS